MARIFIICCIYGANPAYLRAQLASIQSQSQADWRCLLLDDGGNDAMIAEIDALCAADPRFAYRRNTVSLGVYRNFEVGLQAAPEDCALICFCDQDDVWEPQKLAQLAAAFDDPAVLLAHSDLALIDGADRLLEPSAIVFEGRDTADFSAARLVLRNSVTGCAAMLRRDLLAHVLPFPEMGPQRIVLHDSWCAIVAALSGRVAFVPAALVRYRQHGGNIVGAVTGPAFANPRAALVWTLDYARLTEAIRRLVLTALTRPGAASALAGQARRQLARTAFSRLGLRLLLTGNKYGWPALCVGCLPVLRPIAYMIGKSSAALRRISMH